MQLGGLLELVDFIVVKLLTMDVLAGANTFKIQGFSVLG